MRFIKILVVLACVASMWLAAPVQSNETNSAFFNGKDLDGWEGLKGIWSVKENAIVGLAPSDLAFNTFLCSKKKYKDFEMKFQVKLKGGEGNSGVQIRSEIFDREHMAVRGPQADYGEGYYGSLYGEGSGMIKEAPAEAVEKVVKKADFNDYYIKCVGKHCTIKFNGLITVDGDFPEIPDEGIIAFQIHAGYGAMEVTFRNIEFKDLSAK